MTVYSRSAAPPRRPFWNRPIWRRQPGFRAGAGRKPGRTLRAPPFIEGCLVSGAGFALVSGLQAIGAIQ